MLNLLAENRTDALNLERNALKDSAASPVRVAMVIPRYHPVFGGAENQCRLLIRHLVCSGQAAVPFVVTMRADAQAPPRDLVDGVPIRRLGLLGPGRWCSFRFYGAAFVFLLLRRRQFDVIHCHATSVIGFVMTWLGLLTRRPVVLKLSSNGEFVQGLSVEKNRASILGRCRTALQRRLARWTAAHARLVALNAEGRAELRAAGATRPVVIPNGLDPHVFAPPTAVARAARRREHGFGDGDHVFLFTGRFVAGKGLDLLLTAAQRLLERPESTHLHFCLAGSGCLQSESVEPQIAEALGRFGDQIHVLPPKTPVTDYLHLADTFVFPSRREGMPNAVLEALATGLPCVLSDISPHREIQAQNPKAQIALFASGDADTLAQALEDSLVLSPQAGRSLDGVFEIGSVAARYAALYREAVSHA